MNWNVVSIYELHPIPLCLSSPHREGDKDPYSIFDIMDIMEDPMTRCSKHKVRTAKEGNSRRSIQYLDIEVLRRMNMWGAKARSSWAQVCNWFITVNVVEFKRIADGDDVWTMPESTISHDGYPIIQRQN